MSNQEMIDCTPQMLWLLPLPTLFMIACIWWTYFSCVILAYVLYGVYVGTLAVIGVGGTAIMLICVIGFLHLKTKDFSEHEKVDDGKDDEDKDETSEQVDDGIELGDKEPTAITIKNLPANIKTRDVLDLFENMGDIASASVSMDQSAAGNPYSNASVTYIGLPAAMKAIKNFNNRRLDGVPMLVELVSPVSDDSSSSNSITPQVQDSTSSATLQELQDEVLQAENKV